MSSKLEILSRVPWLGSLGPAELEDVAASATTVRFDTGKPILGELELGDELYLLTEGTAEVSVSSGDGHRVLGKLHPGDACGETSLLTRQLRSATVTALEPVAALRLGRTEFEALVVRHPAIAVHFARAIARRVMEMDQALERTLSGAAGSDEFSARLEGRSTAVLAPGGSVRRAWRELVLTHRNELPFFSLLSFTVTLVAIRLLAHVVEARGGSLFDVLRAAYLVGIALILISTATSLTRFRRGVQRVVAGLFGVGFALLLNELSVFLAFDSFYLDMTTRDPRLVFSVETLYRRSESTWAVVLMLAFLGQLTFLRPFYRRALFVLRARSLR